MKISIFFFFIVFFNYSSAQSAIEDTTNLDILSWNIYMLPALANLSPKIKENKKVERAIEIANILNNSTFDIVVFQEVFFIPARKKLSKLLKEKYPFQYGPINKSFIKTNSGIFIVSNIPLTKLATIKYKDCDGSDCFAKKGAGIFEGKFKGKSFQIIGTHLDSRKQSVRENQYLQSYLELIKPYHKKDVPLFFCGDLNTNISNKRDYFSMLKTLKMQNIETSSIQKNTTVEENGVIDYILINTNNSNVKIIEKRILKFLTKLHLPEYMKENLSDHYAIALKVKL